MNLKNILHCRSFYLIIVLTVVIFFLFKTILEQDKQIEVLARQLFSPKSLLYKEDKDLKLVVHCDGGLMLNEDDQHDYFLVDIMVVNQTQKTQEFLTYSCAVLINVITDPDDVDFIYQKCSSNYPITITLKPNQKFQTSVIMQVKTERLYANNKIKFGYIFLKPNEVQDMFVSRQLEKMRENKENIIWSEPLELNLTSYTPFSIEDLTVPTKSRE